MTSTLFINLVNRLPGRLGQRLRDSSNARRIGLNVAWLGVDKVFSILVGVVVSIIVARYLGKESFGLFSYSLALVTIFKALGDVGMEEVLIRDLVKYPEQRYDILGTAFTMRLVGGLTAMLIIAIVVQFARPNDPYARMLVMITSLLYIPQAGMLIYRWYNSKLLAKYNVIASNAALVAIAATRLLLVYFHASLVWFVWTNVGLILLNAIFMFVAYIASGESVSQWRFRWAWCKQLFHDAWPQMPHGVAGAIMMQMGAVMIGGMLGDAEVGAYAVAYRFFTLLIMVPDIVSQSLVPSLTAVHASDRALFERRMAQAYRLLFLLYLATIIPTIVLGLWGIRLLYGAEFATAGRLIIIMCIPMLPVYLGQLRMWFIIIENRIRYMMYIALMQSAVFIVANYLLIRHLGAAGAILAMGIGAMFTLSADGVFKVARRNVVLIAKGLGLLRL